MRANLYWGAENPLHVTTGQLKADLVAEMIKNPAALQETWVRWLGWEDLLEEGKATHSSILAWIVPMDRRAWRAPVHGVAES